MILSTHVVAGKPRWMLEKAEMVLDEGLEQREGSQEESSVSEL